MTLAENLELENQALLRRDGNLLTAVDHGDRLTEMQGRLRAAIRRVGPSSTHYRFDAVHVIIISPFGVQTGGSIGFDSRGTVTEQTYDACGTLLDRERLPSRRRSPCVGRPGTDGSTSPSFRWSRG